MKGSIIKWVFIVFAISLVVNTIILLQRGKGNFEYTKYASIKELYTSDSSAASREKWNSFNKRYSSEEIKAGIEILNSQLQIDTLKTDYEKIVAIASWLKAKFSAQEGYPLPQLGAQTPLQQYKQLDKIRTEKLWCSHYQAIFGFYCTLAKIENRYVELVPVRGYNKAGFHEINEVYLPQIKQWVMVDVTRNLLVVKQQNKLLTAAEYYTQVNSIDSKQVIVTKWNKNEKRVIDSSATIKQEDYFNKNYAIRYYYTMNLEEVYSLKKNIKRYVLGNPWYEMYDPYTTNKNSYFRLRQLFILLSFLSGVLLVFSIKKWWSIRCKKEQQQ